MLSAAKFTSPFSAAILLLLAVLEMEPGASPVPGKGSTTELHFPPTWWALDQCVVSTRLHGQCFRYINIQDFMRCYTTLLSPSSLHNESSPLPTSFQSFLFRTLKRVSHSDKMNNKQTNKQTKALASLSNENLS